jgi:hypothetical protein
MEHFRKQAKALVRAFRDGDAEAVRRAEAVLGTRARERFLLTDAQHVVARDQGFRTWAELKHARESGPAWIDGEDVVVSTGLGYAPDHAVEVTVRKRGWRFDVSDNGRAVELAGRPAGWRDVAEDVVESFAINVNRRGVVFVQANTARLDALTIRVAECSVALYEALLDHELGSR